MEYGNDINKVFSFQFKRELGHIVNELKTHDDQTRSNIINNIIDLTENILDQKYNHSLNIFQHQSGYQFQLPFRITFVIVKLQGKLVELVRRFQFQKNEDDVNSQNISDVQKTLSQKNQESNKTIPEMVKFKDNLLQKDKVENIVDLESQNISNCKLNQSKKSDDKTDKSKNKKLKKELKSKINLSINTSTKTMDVSSSLNLDSTCNTSKSNCNQTDSCLLKSSSDFNEFNSDSALQVADDLRHKLSCEHEYDDNSNCQKTKSSGSLFLKDEFIVKCTVKTKNQVVRFTKFHPMSHALECKPTYPKFLFKQDWLCIKCGHINFNYRNDCCKCKKIKRETDIVQS